MCFRILKGTPNTYIYTKSVAEELLRTQGKGLPVAVFRPSIGKCADIAMFKTTTHLKKGL